MISNLQLKSIIPVPQALSDTYLPLLNSFFLQYEVNNPLRLAAFISQIAHESGCFKYTAEIASGEAYENRIDLGNTHKGDGKKFKGRGLIQITGRFNYHKISQSFFNDDRLLTTPEILQTPIYATRSAFWFWQLKSLNILADIPDFIRITKRINGGLNGYAERLHFYNKALEVLNTV